MLVKLLTYTPEPDKLVAAAAKLCYSDAHIETIMDGLTPEKTDAFLKKLSSMGHQSPTEHAYFTFGIEGVSKRMLKEWLLSLQTKMHDSFCPTPAKPKWL